jgi:hypothetical protein
MVSKCILTYNERVRLKNETLRELGELKKSELKLLFKEGKSVLWFDHYPKTLTEAEKTLQAF